jgi:hypothetical protein
MATAAPLVSRFVSRADLHNVIWNGLDPSRALLSLRRLSSLELREAAATAGDLLGP